MVWYSIQYFDENSYHYCIVFCKPVRYYYTRYLGTDFLVYIGLGIKPKREKKTEPDRPGQAGFQGPNYFFYQSVPIATGPSRPKY